MLKCNIYCHICIRITPALQPQPHLHPKLRLRKVDDPRIPSARPAVAETVLVGLRSVFVWVSFISRELLVVESPTSINSFAERSLTTLVKAKWTSVFLSLAVFPMETISTIAVTSTKSPGLIIMALHRLRELSASLLAYVA